MNTKSWIVSLLFLAACATKPQAPRETDTVSAEALQRERQRAVVPTPQPPSPRPPVVAGKGDCAPPAKPRVTLASCCNDRPCIGECVEPAPGKIECDCFGVRGGCAAGLVCCQFRRACVKPEDCDDP